MTDPHHRALETMYLHARCNDVYDPTIVIDTGMAEITIEAGPQFHHAAHAVHGSVYFKMLDDAAFFAANSIVEDTFVLTASFNIELLRPVVAGTLRAVGELHKPGRQLLFAHATLFGPDGEELARGSGTFARSGVPLDEKVGYTRGG